ncbi:hypothetical protein, partial [Halobellus sp. Atlit-38R]|uniref:hypothetical protein n=1 Tax=Halobellus sp. Atlit-38R TaxID=2282131 RepID=UPI001F182DEB
ASSASPTPSGSPESELGSITGLWSPTRFKPSEERDSGRRRTRPRPPTATDTHKQNRGGACLRAAGAKRRPRDSTREGRRERPEGASGEAGEV